MTHQTVLQTEAVELLNISPQAIVVDCTLGSGGHAKEILTALHGGHFIGLDVDPQAIADNASLYDTAPSRVDLINRSFREIKEVLSELSVSSVDAILADLGWRSEQFEAGKRGFSFTSDEPLLMTLGDPAQYLFTAYDIVNDWAEESIADIIYGYGEERFARRIARKIVEVRADAEIKTAKELASIVAAAVPAVYRRGRINPATKTFQALRIAVNDELGALKDLLKDGMKALRPGGRMAIITFHSLEDRIVKHAFRQFAHDQVGTLVTKKPQIPTPEEIVHNPRARSAKLRCIEKV